MIVFGDVVDGLDIKQSCDEIVLKINKRNGDDYKFRFKMEKKIIVVFLWKWQC